MPIDPSIPLGVRPAQFNLGDMLGGMQAVQQMRDQQQQSTYRGMQLRKLQDDQADEDAINHAIQTSVTADGQPDYGLAASTLERLGRGQAAQKIRQFQSQQEKAHQDAAKAALETEAKRYEVVDTRGGLAYNLLAAAKKDPSSYGAVRSQIGTLMGEDVASFLPPQFDATKVDQAMAWWQNTKPAIDARKQVLAEIAQNGLTAKNERETFDFWTKQAGTWMATTRTPQERAEELDRAKQMGVPPAVLAQFGDPSDPQFMERAKVLALGPDKAADDARQDAAAKEAARHNRAGEALSAAAGRREQAKFDATYGAGMGDDGKPLPVNPTAKAIAEYRIPPPAARSMATGPGKALMDQVLRLNPDYRGEEFPTRQKMRTAFTSGPQGQTLNSLNTAIEHLDQFVDAAKALDNGSFTPGNAAYNALREAFGSTAPTNFKGIKTIMSGELASAFKKSGATDTEIHNVEQSIKDSNSAQQLIEYATKVAIPALGSKANAFGEQYESVMGKGSGSQLLSGSARKVLSKHGYDPEHPTMGGAPAAGGTVKMKAPNGQTMDVPAADVEHYRSRGATVVGR